MKLEDAYNLAEVLTEERKGGKNNGFKVNFRGTPNHDLYKYIRKVLKTYSSQELNKKQIKDLTNNDFYNIRLKLDELTKEGRATRENRLHER